METLPWVKPATATEHECDGNRDASDRSAG
jgi:hypothetical protein